MEDFRGKSVIITGASRGIGGQLAVDLGAAGASVVVNYLSSERQAAEVVNQVGAAGGTAVPCRADISRAIPG